MDFPDRGEKPIASAGHRLDESWSGSRISERFSNLVDGRIESAVKLDKCVSGPQPLLQFFARDHLAGILEQQGQDAERLFLQRDLQAVLPEFPGFDVHLEGPEPDRVGTGSARLHR